MITPHDEDLVSLDELRSVLNSHAGPPSPRRRAAPHRLRRVRLLALAVVVTAGLSAALTYRHYHHYRDTVVGGGQPVTVLVAKTAIPKGTSAQLIATKPLYTVETLRQSQVLKDSLSLWLHDPSELKGRVTVKAINRGQQLTAADFGLPAP